jgi:hypothetical protein
MTNRAVLVTEGGTPGDLDFRFKMNAVFRSIHKATAKKAVLRRSQKTTISYENTREVPLVHLETLLETLLSNQRLLRSRINQQYRKMGRDVPLRYRSVDESEPPQTPDLTTQLSSQDKKSLRYITEIQEIEKQLAKDEEVWHRNVLTRQLVEKTVAYASASVKSRHARAASKLKLEHPSSPEIVQEKLNGVLASAPLPKLVPAVVGIEVSYLSSKDIHPQDYDRLASFLERYPDENRWFAPQEARAADDKVLPMPQKWETLCLKNLRTKGPLAHLTKEVKEALAWRWLIISHNHVFKTDRVPLSPRLSISYERKAGTRGPTRPITQITEESLGKIMEEFRKTIQTPPVSAGPAAEPSIPISDVTTFVGWVWESAKAQLYFGCDTSEGNRFVVKPGKEKAYAEGAKRWNTVMEQADILLEGVQQPAVPPTAVEVGDLDRKVHELLMDAVQTGPSNEEDQQGPDPSEFDKAHPEFIELDGRTYFRFDIDIIDVAEGQVFRTVRHGGVEYFAVDGEPSGPVKGAKARGKTTTRPASPPAEKSTGGKAAGKSEGPSGPPLSKENPLKVKGEAKSKALSDGQRQALRKYFKLEDTIVPADVWASLSNKERASEMSKRSIPRWATEAVLRSASNLQLIVEGKLTKENSNSAARTPKVALTKSTSQAMEAWQQLKSDFKGTSLFRNPQTSKEKAFKKRFDQLVVDYGQQPCFPKLRERPDQQGRSPSRGRGSSRRGDSGLLDMVKTFGELARAFRG